MILITLQELLNQLDIGNFFVLLLATDPEQIAPAIEFISNVSTDKVPISVEYIDGSNKQKRMSNSKADFGYNYNSLRPNKIKDIDQLSVQHKELLLESKTFCIYPWIHMHVEPNGRTFPCCGSEYTDECTLGNSNNQSLKTIWNSSNMKTLRLNMLSGKSSPHCTRCYEQENSGFFSMRNSANKHHGHHISLVDQTASDGALEQFNMIYWDLRFSNLCNLKCRSCGPSFSSSWYQDQLKIAPDYGKNHKALLYAGKYETDLWEQLIKHIDYVEQIYFAGGEPIMMDEHYKILEELERRNKFNVRLIYNTNFTKTKLKDKTVFEYWKKFDSVSVGASLDAEGIRAEYIRKGTDWNEVEQNRKQMIQTCPNVDFYVSATLSIMNALHLPDFHKNWTEKGLIKAKDFNINILTNPEYYRLDIATTNYKQQIEEKYQQHLAWLTPQDDLRRASNGYESALAFMNATDNTHLLDAFWKKTQQLDAIRDEYCLDILPELKNLI
jgi:radical SAM protein with 4Fe4S-binding SPASM domain